MGVMCIDHLAAVLKYSSGLNMTAYSLMRGLGRVAMPIFCYFIVVGLRKTSDRSKYFGRLCFFALVSQIPYTLALSPNSYTAAVSGSVCFGLAELLPPEWALAAFLAVGATVMFGKKALIPLLALAVLFVRISFGELGLLGERGNVFYNLALGMAVIWFVDEAVKNRAEKMKLLFAAAILAAAVLLVVPRADYGWRALALIVPLYLCAERKWAELLCISAWSLVVFPPAGNLFGMCMCLGCLSSVGLVAFYNGKKGPGLKRAFYAFYPLHLTVFYFLGSFIGPG